jgi:hypothetical protein
MEKVKMSTAAELKKANEITNFAKYKAKVYGALANDTYGLTISQLSTVCKLSAKTIKQILAELEVEKNGDVYLLKSKQPVPATTQFPIYDNWLSKNMNALRQATAHLSNNDVNDIIEVAGRLIWEASKNQTVPEGYVLVTEDQAKDTARLDFLLDDSTKRTVCHQKFIIYPGGITYTSQSLKQRERLLIRQYLKASRELSNERSKRC